VNTTEAGPAWWDGAVPAPVLMEAMILCATGFGTCSRASDALAFARVWWISTLPSTARATLAAK
jgi:hypothetical protein